MRIWGRYNDGGWTCIGIGDREEQDKHFREAQKEEGGFPQFHISSWKHNRSDVYRITD